MMIIKSDVNYTEEIIENLSVSDIRDIYAESLIMWICGSGSGTGHPAGNYYCVLDYKGNTRFIEGEMFWIVPVLMGMQLIDRARG